jgi:pimeloyl-ACP methyl ester carboxylesterase
MRVACFAAFFVLSLTAAGQSVPAAIYTDPPRDPAHPASMTVLHIPTHGVEINGVQYAPPGATRHPTLLICHGLPGNEKNLDLAQAVRRAGWNAVTFNYRGSWGSAGNFRFAQNVEDAAAVLTYLRNPANAARLGIDVDRIAIAGHSMGGWVAVHTAAHDHALLGAILISAADMGALADGGKEKLTAMMQDDKEALAGVTAESMAEEIVANAKAFRFAGAIDGLSHTPMLVLSANDGLAAGTDALVQAVKRNENQRVTAIHEDTDHVWSDRRIFLESTVITWLDTLH